MTTTGRNGTHQLLGNTNPAEADDDYGRLFWDPVAKHFKQIDQDGNIAPLVPQPTSWGDIIGLLSDQTDLQLALDGKKDDFSENTAFNKNFGSGSGDVCEGDDARLSDSRTPTTHAPSHELGGSDEIDVTGLSGVLADNQKVATDSSLTGTGEAASPLSAQTALDLKEDTANKGVANGYCPLDSSSLVPLSNLPDSVKTGSEYKGAYNASTNTPTISDGAGENGEYYRVSVAGSQDFGSGSIDMLVGDLIIYNGALSVWQRVAGNPDLVQSVAGKQGVVILDKTDVGLSNVDNTSDIDKPISNATQTALDGKLQSGDNVSELVNDAGYITSAPISSVFGRVGSVVAEAGDYNAAQVTNAFDKTADDSDDIAEGAVNLFLTVAQQAKLAGIESGAQVNTVDSVNGQVGSVLLDADNIDDSSTINKFVTSAQIVNIDNQSGVNTGDETDLSVKTKYEANADTNAFTDAEKTKLANLEGSKFVGEFISLAALQAAFPTAPIGSYAYVDTGAGQDVEKYIWDDNDSQWVLQQGESTAETPASIKSKYESNPDTNAFTDAEKTNLANQSGINTGDETLATLQSKRPLRTVDGQAIDGAGGDISIGVSFVSGDGVNNSNPATPLLSFPNADEVSDAGTANKFASQAELDKLAAIEAGAQVNTVDSVNGQTGVVILDKSDIGLGSVDNTSDADKPVSTATQLALDGKKDDFSENTAFNKNFGSASGDVCEGDDPRLSDSRTPISHAPSHQQGGVDEIDVGGLSGVLADNQKVATDATITGTGETGSPISAQAALDLKQDLSEKGSANGYCPLNASSLVPLSNLPDSVKTGSEYKGSYDASTNTPTVSDGVGDNGDYYRVSVAGSQDFGSGTINMLVGDLIIYNGTLSVWQRVAGNPDLVQSVAGKQGVVTLDKSDVGLSNVDNTSDANKPLSIAAISANTALQAAINLKVDSVNGQNGVVVIDADDIDDATTTNKFANQAQLDQIATNQADITNRVVIPPGPSFEGDILQQTAVAGVFVFNTPKGGVVKLNNVVQGVALGNNQVFQVDLSGGTESFNTSTDFPKNIANQFPGQDPISDPATFIPFLYDSATQQWLENNVQFQVHNWRVQVDYTRVANQNNRELICILRNPLTAFEISLVRILPGGPQFQTSTVTYDLTTIADSNSIGTGYILELETVQAGLTINDLSIVRVSQEKI